MTVQPALDPACAGDDAFCDALVGLDRVCRWLAGELERARVRGATQGVDDGRGSGDGPAGGDGDAPVALDEPLAAVLGLVSLGTTLSLVLGALSSEVAEAAPEAGAVWSRELLR